MTAQNKAPRTPKGIVEALRAAYDFYMGPHASGDFTCNCGDREHCGICDMRESTETTLQSLEEATR